MLFDVPEQQEDLTGALAEITACLVAGQDGGSVLRLVTEACVRLFDVAAIGVMLVDPRGGVEVVSASDERARFVELLQSQLQEGPCLDCVHTGTMVDVEDLSASRSRWPAFAAAATAAGYRSVHAIPMRLGGHPVGAMNLLHTERLTLPAMPLRLAQTFADLAVLGLTQERDDHRRAERLAEQTLTALNDRVAMGQAVGMVAGTLDIEPDHARTLLNTYARRESLAARDLALAVLGGRMDLAALSALITDAN
jgi:GAF domain-containing protein